MRRTLPLPQTNPEFSVLDSSSFREYKVENWRLARDGSQRIIKGAKGLTWKFALILAVLSFVWRRVCMAFIYILLTLRYRSGFGEPFVSRGPGTAPRVLDLVQVHSSSLWWQLFMISVASNLSETLHRVCCGHPATWHPIRNAPWFPAFLGPVSITTLYPCVFPFRFRHQ